MLVDHKKLIEYMHIKYYLLQLVLVRTNNNTIAFRFTENDVAVALDLHQLKVEMIILNVEN